MTKVSSPPPLIIGDLVSEVPIIQGGMGVGISLSNLASAVANEKAIGVIATAGIAKFQNQLSYTSSDSHKIGMIQEIRKARKASPKGIIGVNIMVVLSNYNDLVKTAIEEGIDIIFSGAGLPLSLPEFLTPGCKTKLVPIVSSERAANIICSKWLKKYNYLPDAIVVEGPLAGGHLGFHDPQNAEKLEEIVPKVITVVQQYEAATKKKIPVIAGGGIYSGADIHKFFKLGVSGVQMATRFVVTNECDASLEFKKMYLKAKEDDIVIIHSPVGLPGRVIRNQFIDDIQHGKKKPFNCPYKCIISCDYKNAPFCIAKALFNAQEGNLDNGFAFAGYNAYKTDKIISVKELINDLMNEYSDAVKKS